jgi:thioesterase domain-containing protein
VERMLLKASRISESLTRGQTAPAEMHYQSLDEIPSDVFVPLVRNAVKDYRPGPLDSRAVLFRARDAHNAHLHAFDPSMGWKGLFSGGLGIVDMPGGHSTILLQENLPGLARQLQRNLDAVLDAPQKKPPSRKELALASGR